MGFQLTGFWGKAQQKLAKLPTKIREQATVAGAEIANELKAMVKEEMHTADYPPLHPFTVERKGNDKPLVGGDLEASIQAGTSNGGLVVWVGVSAEMSMIAKVQEYGCTIDLTPNMRHYLASQGLVLSPDTQSIVIPERPFLRPALRKARGMIRARYGAALQKALRSR